MSGERFADDLGDGRDIVGGFISDDDGQHWLRW
jgi:hypothetical protein